MCMFNSSTNFYHSFQSSFSFNKYFPSSPWFMIIFPYHFRSKQCSFSVIISQGLCLLPAVIIFLHHYPWLFSICIIHDNFPSSLNHHPLLFSIIHYPSMVIFNIHYPSSVVIFIIRYPSFMIIFHHPLSIIHGYFPLSIIHGYFPPPPSIHDHISSSSSPWLFLIVCWSFFLLVLNDKFITLPASIRSVCKWQVSPFSYRSFRALPYRHQGTSNVPHIGQFSLHWARPAWFAGTNNYLYDYDYVISKPQWQADLVVSIFLVVANWLS